MKEQVKEYACLLARYLCSGRQACLPALVTAWQAFLLARFGAQAFLPAHCLLGQAGSIFFVDLLVVIVS
jgi:hypothetical protein